MDSNFRSVIFNNLRLVRVVGLKKPKIHTIMQTSNSSILNGIQTIKRVNSNTKAQRDTHGLGVDVLYGHTPNYPQLTNRFKDLVLVDGRGVGKRNLESSRVINNGDDYLVLVEKVFFGEVYLRAIPKSILDSGVRSMFGGNFIYTSDSRFPSDHPIKVHDRVE